MKVRFIGNTIDSPAIIIDKIYDVISVQRGWYRIMTELDQDYLFPPSMFEIVQQ